MTPRKIDMTPSWAATAQILLTILELNPSPEAKAFARSEILRMGKIIDNLQAKEGSK